MVAEMSANHNQSFERAIQIVEAAAKAGCDAVKIQTYTADTMTIDASGKEFFIEDEQSLWKGRSLYRLYQEASTPWKWHEAIFRKCAELGLISFSTPFDLTAVDFLETLNVPAYKIGSFENTDIPLLRKVGATGKPVLMSTGMSTLEELTEAVEAIRDTGNDQIVLLKCTSAYPAAPGECHLRTIAHMRESFGLTVGLSDHTLGVGIALAGIALGARVVEKHFTLSRADGGVDSAFSLEPGEMALLVREARKVYDAVGDVHYGPTPQEKKSLQFRRSIYVVEDMQEGETFSQQNLRIIRPGLGLCPKFYEKILGRHAKSALRKGTPLTWDMVL
ncbi:MAG: pseudaminic acid synthase [Candidatus Omnitrophica bacterium]|nr:pseudaminic acid synthase [Candidatus Omnitrophota bacterium]